MGTGQILSSNKVITANITDVDKGESQVRLPSVQRGIPDRCDIAVIGAGAAGLAAAIFAAETAGTISVRIVLLESAKKPGAKILISGGGRCNVTNERVSGSDFWGGSSHTVRKVINSFGNQKTIDWFRRLGVALKREPTGKLFPTSDKAQTVLSALLNRVDELGIELRTGSRVTDIVPNRSGFAVDIRSVGPTTTQISARCVIVATGGLALPKSGSDGAGLSILARLGHTIVPTTPSLVPLVLKKSRSIGGRFAEFSGITMDARLRLMQGNATKPVTELRGSLLFTHLGISGPLAMDFSRHWLRAKLENPHTGFRVLLGVPGLQSALEAEARILASVRAHPKRQLGTFLNEFFPSRIAQAIADDVGIDTTLSQLTRAQRRRLAELLIEMTLEIVGTRGYAYAEATAGGVDLREIEWKTMSSRLIPNLYLCGEILDVDGRIGGFNFQWAWSSGYLAGRGAIEGVNKLM